MTDDDVKRVVTTCERLHPIIQKQLIRLMDNEKPEVAISIMTSVVIELMVHTITMVEVQNGDVMDFVDAIMKDVSQRQREISARIQTEAALRNLVMPTNLPKDGSIH